MWLVLSFVSAALLGLYDVSKKVALRENAVIPVLFATTLVSSLIFLPFILISRLSPETLGPEGLLYVPSAGLEAHGLIFLKSIIVLSSWLLGYLGMKHLPLTLVGPINATRPVMVLLGAMLLFGERLNLCQWIGVGCALLSLWLLSLSGKREGVSFTSNRWIICVFGAALLGAASGLYDRYLLRELPPMLVQSWYSLYQVLLMGPLLWSLWHKRAGSTPLSWHPAIILIPIFLSLADFAYFMALAETESMISVVSMIRRGSVVVSFACGAWVLEEKNLKAKALDLLLILIGMVFLYLGSRG